MSAVAVAVCLALSARANAVVNDLGSPSFQEREAAQAQLLAIGGPALPAVNRAVASPDPEVARRAQGLAKEIGFQLDCARLLAGTPVRLDFTDAPLSTVLLALSRQSGYALGVLKAAPDPNSLKVTVRTGDVTFWSAVEAVGKAAGLSVNGTNADDGTVRYFVPDVGPTPKTPGDKIRAWAAEVETLVRTGQALDQQARGVLEVYRNDLRQYANGATAIEKAMSEGKADRLAPSSLERFAVQAESRYKAARNLFTAAGLRSPVGPGGRYPVILGPANGPVGTASAGIWVEPSATSPAIPQLARTSPSGIRSPSFNGPFVHLRVVPEPRIEWVRTTGLRVDFATDEGGRAVEPNLLASQPEANVNDDIAFLGGGRVIRRSYAISTAVRANPFYASTPLKAELPVPTALKEFRGVIQGLVKAAPEEVVVKGLSVEGKVSADSNPKEPLALRQRLLAFGNEPTLPSGASPVLTTSLKEDPSGYALEVSLQYSSETFSPAGGNGMDTSGQMSQIARVAPGGAVVMIEQHNSGRRSSSKAESNYGLRVTDASGRPFDLSGGVDFTRVSQDGSGPVYVHLTLNVTSSNATKGPPVRIAWRASRHAPVEVPFALTNVPVVK